MAYVTPTIDVAGLHLPSYNDILDDLILLKQGLYGSDIYLGEDSTDYQELSVFALKIYDVFQAIRLAYNNRSPVTAIGSGLDGVVKINGITRQAASYSTCDVILTGAVGTIITNGIVQDTSKQNWNLPSTVTIPGGGQITVTVTSAVAGDIQALAGTINKIVTLQAGWYSVNNSQAAVLGSPIESDSELRARQTISTAISSVSPMDSLMGTVAAVSGVSRLRGYENDTGTPDGNGVPGHSICVVVEGGDATEIAEAIALKKTIGCGTYGTTTVEVYDYKGNPIDINFSHADPVYISVKIVINSLPGYSSLIGEMIKEAVANYINSIEIGDDVFLTKITAAASLWGTSAESTFVVTAVELGRPGDSPPTSANNVVIDFDETAVCYTGSSPDYIELVVT